MMPFPRVERPTGLLALFGGFCLAAVLLSGCSNAPDDVPSGEENSGGSAGAHGDDSAEAGQESSGQSAAVATVSVDGRSFDFELRMCSVTGDGEVLLSGLGGEAGSEVPSHLDGDATPLDGDTYGEFRIDIGSDGPFQSSDVFISLGNSLGGSYALSEVGDGYLVTASAWNENGADLGSGTLQFTCE